MKKIFISILFLCLALGLASLFAGCSEQKKSNIPPGRPVLVTVEPGMSAAQIAELLEDRGIIDSARSFSSQIRSKKLGDSLQAGEYDFVTGMPQNEVIEKLVQGEVRYVSITIPEGFNVKQIAQLLEEKNLVKRKEFLALAKDYTPYDYMQTADERLEYKSEGFLFPATYHIAPGVSAEAILGLLVRTFDERLTAEMREQIAAADLTIRDFITLASLVEKEAAYDEDRKFIARAFLKRLEIEMPLQSCATIQYILGYPKAELTIADTQLPSDYNTYLHYGLPPGPIANPGFLAMQSVLQPAAEEYLYFVVQANGKHIFSKTYDEHLAAIASIENAN